MKIKDLYINPKNVCTIGLYMYGGEYGLEINGSKFVFGSYSLIYDDKENGEKIAKELKKYQQMIIDEVEQC